MYRFWTTTPQNRGVNKRLPGLVELRADDTYGVDFQPKEFFAESVAVTAKGPFPRDETVLAQMRCTERPPKTKVAGCRFLLGAWKAMLWFPMSIRFGIGRGCRPDIRVQAFQFLALSDETDEGIQAQTITLNERGFIRNARRICCCAGRVAGIAAIHILLPRVLPMLEKVVCVTGFFTAFVRPASKSESTDVQSNSIQIMEWKNFSIIAFIKEIVEQMYLPLCICRGIKEGWSYADPESYYLLDCSILLLEVDREQKLLKRRIANGRIRGDTTIEKAWLDLHKRSAQRIAHLMNDLPDTPPLKRLLEIWEENGILIGSCSKGSIQLVHCLDNGNSFSIVMQFTSTRTTTDVSTIATRSLPVGEIRHVASSSNDRPRLPAVPKATVRRPISEISEYPLEAEMDMASSLETDATQTQRSSTEEISSLPLYGRYDHADNKETKRSLTESMELSIRTAELVFAFLPFLLLGLLLLLIAYSLDTRGKRKQKDDVVEQHSLTAWRRNCVNRMRTTAFGQLLQGCRESGTAFIKWGQWSSTREDLFSEEFCDVLSSLHDQAPAHSMQETREEILKAFRRPLEEIFESFDTEPLASGSVAQVHRAVYKKNGQSIPVIVKVRHPNISRQIGQDFAILKPLAEMASQVTSLQNLPLKQSISQFSSTMTAQTNFKVEAAHMRRFSRNFESVKDAVVIPKVIDELVSESVLVETFEKGDSVKHFIKNPSPINTKIVSLGVDTYLKMLLNDNFVHTDLHPGNILVRNVDNGKGVQIVLLDFGLAEEVQTETRRHFISFLNFMAKGDGINAAKHMLQWSQQQQCPNPSQFIADMQRLFEVECNIRSEAGINVDAVIKKVLRLARTHVVSVDSAYSTLVLGVCMIVGFAQNLDPRVNLMDAAAPVLLTYALTGRVVGRLYG